MKKYMLNNLIVKKKKITSNKVYLLKKALYGLKKAPRA
jgi:hypothetical protein